MITVNIPNKCNAFIKNGVGHLVEARKMKLYRDINIIFVF